LSAVTQAGAVSRDGNDLRVAVRVQPRASRNEIEGTRDGRLRIRTTAAPAGGKANKAVTRLLADYLGVAPSRIRLVRGMTQRNKLFVVEGPVELPDGL
jgi:uncharacterized protein (TIGR00251 family)